MGSKCNALDVFLQHCQFLSFDEYGHIPQRGNPKYIPRYLVQSLIDLYQRLFKELWTLGRNVAVDESMIKYCGLAMDSVQYMPAKPIKHGIKVNVM